MSDEPSAEDIAEVMRCLDRDTRGGISGDEYSQGAFDTLRWLRGEQECPFVYLDPPETSTTRVLAERTDRSRSGDSGRSGLQVSDT